MHTLKLLESCLQNQRKMKKRRKRRKKSQKKLPNHLRC